MTGVTQAIFMNHRSFTVNQVPVNTTAPAVTGTTTVGQTLTTTNGTWTGVPSPTFTYQWFRSPSTSISGATSSTYTLTAADAGNTIYCRVTATNAAGSASANSNTTSAILGLPGTPTIGTASIIGLTTGQVTFTAPTNSGYGSSIIRYEALNNAGSILGSVTTGGGGTFPALGGSGIVTINLVAGASDQYRVRAVNSAGNGPVSGYSNAVDSPPTLGTALAGGFFAGLYSMNANGVPTHKLILAPKSTGEYLGAWMTAVNVSSPGAQSTSDGYSNTINTNNSNHPISQYCINKTVGGYTDWYCPSKNELEICYRNFKPSALSNNTSSGSNPNAVPPTGNYTTTAPTTTTAPYYAPGGSDRWSTSAPSAPSGTYWTSTRQSGATGLPWVQYMYSNGGAGNQQLIAPRTNQGFVRPMRKVPV